MQRHPAPTIFYRIDSGTKHGYNYIGYCINPCILQIKKELEIVTWKIYLSISCFFFMWLFKVLLCLKIFTHNKHGCRCTLLWTSWMCALSLCLSVWDIPQMAQLNFAERISSCTILTCFLRDTFFFKCGENDFKCHDTFDSESEMTSN